MADQPAASAGWYPDPDPGAAPGRLRYWDGTAWTGHVTEPSPPSPPPPPPPMPPPAPAGPAPAGPAAAVPSPLSAELLVLSPPRAAGAGTRVFEVGDGAGGRLGRLVETTRGANDSAIGAVLSRAGHLQGALTRELRGADGWPVLVLAWSPRQAGTVSVARPDRTQAGWLAGSGPDQPDPPGRWAMTGADGRVWGTAHSGGAASWDGRPLLEVVPDGAGGWTARRTGPVDEPLASLTTAAAMAADLL